MSDEKARSRALDAVAPILDKHFEQFVILGIPKGSTDRVSVCFYCSAPEALELIQKGEARIKDTLH